MRGPLRRSGPAPEAGQAVGIEGMQDIADRLSVAAQGLGNHPGGLASGPGEQELTATSPKGMGRPQAFLECLRFVRGHRTDIDGFSHAQESTILPTTLRATALGVLFLVTVSSAFCLQTRPMLENNFGTLGLANSIRRLNERRL
jgi:hypothetical protein